MIRVVDIRRQFASMYEKQEFVSGRGEEKMLEILGASFLADEETIFGKLNQKYIDKELLWYNSQSTNIFDLDENPPEAWKNTANIHGQINSNYGHLIYSDKYYRQYRQVFLELERNPNSRRAVMIYTRPSIWVEYDENQKNDFICTNTVSYYIREHVLHCVVQMRSNDIWAGYRNDRAWQLYVLECLAQDLCLDVGDIYWQVQNLHCYPKNFNLIEEYLNE